MKKLFILILILLLDKTGKTQNIAAIEKTLKATRFTTVPKIDGLLNDAVWNTTAMASDFITSYPNIGEPSTKTTTVRIGYDDNAFYIGAFMQDDVKNIRKQLNQRDKHDRADVDYFSVFFDTYNDNQNAFMFLVTAAGVQSDGRLSGSSPGSDFGIGVDETWDAVWLSKVAILQNGWSVELKIPLSAIRFPKKESQVWGLQFGRQARKINETSYWAPLDRNKSGFVNQFGILNEIEKIVPPLRLSFLPYTSVAFKSTPDINKKFVTENFFNGGMDIKYGINESFTLDATLVPDFGQVQSDNQILNLSPFEVRFTDFRPFFQEGTELFNKAGLFYSRRVGDLPAKFFEVQNLSTKGDTFQIKQNPTLTQLYNATKVSGFTKNNIGIGVFNAVTAPMYAKVFHKYNNSDSVIETSPLTNYNILVVDKIFKNRSYITFTNTNVWRNGNARDANVTSLFTRWIDKKNNYELKTFGKYSKIFGLKSYDGFTTGGTFSKISGNLNFSAGTNIESDKYDPNDLGFLLAPNEVIYFGNITYRQLKAGKSFLNRSFTVSGNYNMLYKPYAFQNSNVNASVFYLFKNFWDNTIRFSLRPTEFNDAFEARTSGYNVKRPWYYAVSMRGSTDSRKKLYGRWQMIYGNSPVIRKDDYTSFDLGTRYRFSPKFQLEYNYINETDKGQFGYSTRISGQPIIAFRKVTSISNIVSAAYGFNALMSATFRLRHYWSKVNNYRFFDLNPNGKLIDRAFINNLNRNFNAFNIDAFYIWNFKPGSQLILNWKNALGPFVNIPAYTNTKYADNVEQVFRNPHSNEISLRVIFFLDYLQLKRKKSKA